MKTTLATVLTLLALSMMVLPAVADQDAEGPAKGDEAIGAVQENLDPDNECKDLELPGNSEPNNLSCSAYVSCPESGSVSCNGWSICQSVYPNCPNHAGYVDCDGNRTYCPRAQCFDCNPLQCYSQCGGGECIDGECVCW